MPSIPRARQHLCKSFPGEKGERSPRRGEELAGCFRDAPQAVSLRRAPSRGCHGEQGPHGTARHGPHSAAGASGQPARDETVRSRWAESPESTSSHQSFWQEEQIILRESCFWRLLNCSWHCSESFNSLENPKHFNIARIFAHRMPSPATKWDPASVEPAHRGDTSPLPFLTSRGKDAETEPGSPLRTLSRPRGSANTSPTWLARNRPQQELDQP